MPKALHDKLEREADKKGLKGDRRRAYIYGTMRNTGWVPEREKKACLEMLHKIDLLNLAYDVLRLKTN